MMKETKCYACFKKVSNPKIVDTHEDQFVHVGSNCFNTIRIAGSQGYQPTKGGPRLFLMTSERWEYFKRKFNIDID